MSVEMIECRLTGLTRKPHAEHHRGDASPAESEFLASAVYTSSLHTLMYDTGMHMYTKHTCKLLLSVLPSCHFLFHWGFFFLLGFHLICDFSLFINQFFFWFAAHMLMSVGAAFES